MTTTILILLASYARFLAIATKAIPMIRSGIETQSVPASATLFRFRIANTAATTTSRIPISRMVLADKFRPPSDRPKDRSRLSLLAVVVQCLRPTAYRLADERTYITPFDRAGVAINISPIEFVAM